MGRCAAQRSPACRRCSPPQRLSPPPRRCGHPRAASDRSRRAIDTAIRRRAGGRGSPAPARRPVASKPRRSRLPGSPRLAPSPRPSVTPGTGESSCPAATSGSAAGDSPAGCRALCHDGRCARSCARHCVHSAQRRSGLRRPPPSAVAERPPPPLVENHPHPPSPKARTAPISHRSSDLLSATVEVSQLHLSRQGRWPPLPTPPRHTAAWAKSPPSPWTLTYSVPRGPAIPGRHANLAALRCLGRRCLLLWWRQRLLLPGAAADGQDQKQSRQAGLHGAQAAKVRWLNHGAIVAVSRLGVNPTCSARAAYVPASLDRLSPLPLQGQHRSASCGARGRGKERAVSRPPGIASLPLVSLQLLR